MRSSTELGDNKDLPLMTTPSAKDVKYLEDSSDS